MTLNYHHVWNSLLQKFEYNDKEDDIDIDNAYNSNDDHPWQAPVLPNKYNVKVSPLISEFMLSLF